ncbi:MAG: phosphopantothenoylcysteine decarboxylase [Candidatus Scalindua rubra]|uniref:Phosphopantothenoylcysteine n=1 Tax=Candidatus Scalindua brodae TaxID=237368 RepID=A0A0B0ENV3_9BACT|nr:MAG: phosphopantothenoylcysteine [Candidatus Scalindua brodae]MBZ0107493.1 phosphopantothenoylcysteine decarboxylase [Candidatus Scalindua rubra]
MTKNIILGVTGSIAAFKAAIIVSKLKSLRFDITVIMTKSAQSFIHPLTFRTLSQNKVVTDIFIDESVYDPHHVSIAHKADLLVIAPATANVIGKLASGIADDALTSTVMAANVPVIIAPAMEENMYMNPITQRNISILQEVGYKFIGPEKGRLASGRTGIGRLADVELIIRSIVDELSNDADPVADLPVNRTDEVNVREESNAKNKTEDKEKKRLRGPAVTKLYESGRKRHGSIRSS